MAVVLVLSVVARGAAQDISDSEEAQARMQKGISLYQQAQYAAALTEVQLVAEKYPTYAVAYRMVGLCQVQLKQYDKAAESLKKALQLTREQENRDDAAARIALGRAYFYAGKYAEALPELDYAVKQKPNDALNHYLLGFANYKLDKTSDAVASLSQATTLNDKDAPTWRLLAEVYLGRCAADPTDKATQAKAVAAAQKLKTLDPSPESADVLGRAFMASQQFAKAVPEFEKAVAGGKVSPATQFQFGLALSRTEQLAKATQELTKASELLSDNVDVLKELGYVYERDKKPEKAREVYEKADKLTNGQDTFIKNALERVKP